MLAEFADLDSTTDRSFLVNVASKKKKTCISHISNVNLFESKLLSDLVSLQVQGLQLDHP